MLVNSQFTVEQIYREAKIKGIKVPDLISGTAL
jgi:hypothetical protein